MTKVLREAIEKVEALPEEAQARIARELIDYVEGLNALRADLQIGLRQLDAGQGKDIDFEDLMERARAHRGKA